MWQKMMIAVEDNADVDMETELFCNHFTAANRENKYKKASWQMCQKLHCLAC